MFDRAPKGATMISAFKPYMQPARLSSYDLDVRELGEGVTQATAKGPALLSPHAGAAAALKQFDASEVGLAQFDQQWPQVRATISGLLDTIQANRSNYDAVAALPSFTLFPWFFVVPGALLILLAAVALALPSAWRRLRWAIVALAIGLIIAPLAFGMWARAPRGATMVSAFRTVETRGLVTKIQNDFDTITIGEGALSGELVPALEEHGLSTAQIDRALPAVAALENRWIGILQNLTPMIGVMSDNVTNYQAVAALPAFGLFPWLFLIPGLLVLALVALSRTGLRLSSARRPRTSESRAAEPRVEQQLGPRAEQRLGSRAEKLPEPQTEQQPEPQHV
jgi:multisubunit Na+/H+ antiporter MnhG subunit